MRSHVVWMGLVLGTLSLPAFAVEFIPSVGMSRPVDGGASSTTVGLSLRAPLLGNGFQSEVGVGYRREDIAGGGLKIHRWPVTASLWMFPAKSLYLGGGAGWYNTTVENTGSGSSTSQKLGMHLGGGLKVPLGSGTALDLNSRYVFLGGNENNLLPGKFKPDSWNSSLGLALHF